MRRFWLVAILLVVLVGGVLVQQTGLSFLSFGPAVTEQQPKATPAEQDNTPPAVAPTTDTTPTVTPSPAEAPAPVEAVHKGTVEKGDTIGKILEDAGTNGVYDYISAAQQVFSLRSFRAGQPYVVVTDTATGRVKRFEYEIDQKRRLVVEGAESPVARVEPIEYVILLDRVEATISDSLFNAVADVGESPQLALQLAEMFGSEINFIRHIQEGDSFAVLVEKRYRDGEYKGYGRVLAARFTNRGKSFEGYLFRDGKGRAQYYNQKGENLRKTLLQAPLAFTRLTSRFSYNRKHPVLGIRRPHLGVDYAAPTGTPVKAVGDGVVTLRGWVGGYGNQIILRHDAGLESMYAHLSGYARGLKKGSRVRQGQVIGFVGSTGLSTGPHLDFRLRQRGKFIDPTKAINPRSAPVSKKSMPAFKKVMAEELAYLKGEKHLGDYTPDSIVPEREPEDAGKTQKRQRGQGRGKP
ncbi:MAG: peptidoglycan DD-metalloendopeptidase family protein [Desulfovibrionaceae bacterium]|nr:peptidoglycan DD-metalloendopeptidase family protein [Desulfovibrionaceae bacterium]